MALERLRVLLQPSRTAAARTMGSPAALDLQTLFASPDLERDWRPVSARIETLGITPEAGMNPGDRRALYYLMRLVRPASVLEIGTQAGAPRCTSPRGSRMRTGARPSAGWSRWTSRT